MKSSVKCCQYFVFGIFGLFSLLSIDLALAQNVTISTVETNPVTLNQDSLLTITDSGYLRVNGGDAISSSNLSGASVLNNGRIDGEARGLFNYPTSTISSIANNGPVNADFFDAIENQGTIRSIVNSGQLNGGSLNGRGIHNDIDGTIGSITNTGSITSQSYDGILNEGAQIDSITNSGSIAGGGSFGSGQGIRNDTILLTLTNLSGGTITGGDGGSGVQNNGLINAINNSGVITGNSTSGNSYGVFNQGAIGTLNNLNAGQVNSSVSSGDSAYAIFVGSGAQIGTLNNSNSSRIEAFALTGGGNAVGLQNSGAISTINNAGTSLLSSFSEGGMSFGVINDSGASIGTLNNTGSSVINALSNAGASWGIQNLGTIDTLNNAITANISAVDFLGVAVGLENSGIIHSLNNDGYLSATGSFRDVVGVWNKPGASLIGVINNSGNIVSTAYSSADSSIGIFNEDGGRITALNNSGVIEAWAESGPYVYGILNIGTISTLSNTAGGSISGSGESLAPVTGINNKSGGAIGVLNNTGSSIISATNSGGSAYAIGNSGTIQTLNNNGGAIYATAIGGNAFGIFNNGTIATLNNSQGGNSSSVFSTALNYSGNMPANYGIIINNPTSYGQLAVTSPSGAITNFGIYGTPFLTSRTYASVLTNNVTVTNLQGTYDNMTLALVDNGSTYDLTFTGVSLMGTQQSLVNTANALAPIYTLQNSVLANSFAYDCTEFGANNVCVSAGGRNTAVSAANGLNNTSALLIAAYRPHPNYRVGAYVDQNLSVNNAGSTVNLGNNTPLIGLFGAWNERLDGTGTEVKVSAAYGQKNTTITRQVVGLSEPGSGSSQLNSQGAQITGKYGFGVTPDVIVSPYIGMRYTQNNMNGYTEGTSSSVTSPLTYAALNTNATTALAGVGVSYKIVPQVTTFASAGVESDTNTANGTYSATGINGLTPVNFNPNPVKTRPTATLGAYYDIVKNQRLGITGVYRQEPFQSVSTTTVMATYTVGL